MQDCDENLIFHYIRGVFVEVAVWLDLPWPTDGELDVKSSSYGAQLPRLPHVFAVKSDLNSIDHSP